MSSSRRMDKSVALFLQEAESDGQNPMEVAYDLFKLLTQSSKAMFLSAIREANGLKICKIRYLQSLLATLSISGGSSCPSSEPSPLNHHLSREVSQRL